MASNAYRYDDARRGTQGKSRVGLAGVGTGNGGAAPYQLAALQPGSRGFWASSFGAPATGETPDRPLPADPAPAPAAQAPAPAPASGPPEGDASFNQSLGEGGGAGGGLTGGREGMDGGGKPGDLGDLGIEIDGKTIGGVLGSAAGGLLGGPLGALAGGVAGRALGGALDGPANDGMASGSELDGLGAQAEQNAANMAGSGFGDARGLAKGGPVKPGNLHRQIPPKKGLAGVGAGPSFMGGFADGGPVGGGAGGFDPLADRRMAVDAQHWVGGITVPQINATYAAPPGVSRNTLEAMAAARNWERFPNTYRDPQYPVGEMHARILQDPALLNALIEAQGSVHPVNPGSPSTGYQGAYAGGGSVGAMPHYMDGGPVAALAGPDPAGPDDGFAALDQGEFVVRQSQAQRPDYAPILEQMNAGTYDPAADGGMDAGAGTGAGMSVPSQLPDAGTGSRVAAMDPMERATLVEAVSQDPMLAEALTALLGPEGMSLLMSAPVGPEGIDSAAMLASRAPMAGPPPVPGTAAPPGFPPPAQQRGGLASVVNG